MHTTAESELAVLVSWYLKGHLTILKNLPYLWIYHLRTIHFSQKHFQGASEIDITQCAVHMFG